MRNCRGGALDNALRGGGASSQGGQSLDGSAAEDDSAHQRQGGDAEPCCSTQVRLTAPSRDRMLPDGWCVPHVRSSLASQANSCRRETRAHRSEKRARGLQGDALPSQLPTLDQEARDLMAPRRAQLPAFLRPPATGAAAVVVTVENAEALAEEAAGPAGDGLSPEAWFDGVVRAHLSGLWTAHARAIDADVRDIASVRTCR